MDTFWLKDKTSVTGSEKKVKGPPKNILIKMDTYRPFANTDNMGKLFVMVFAGDYTPAVQKP
jgi:hypothetical protein